MNEFYVYVWINKSTNEIFYVGKGHKDRYYRTSARNKAFKKMIRENECFSYIVKDNLTDEEAREYEKKIIARLREKCPDTPLFN